MVEGGGESVARPPVFVVCVKMSRKIGVIIVYIILVSGAPFPFSGCLRLIKDYGAKRK